MPGILDELDYKIISVARKFFLEEGIRKTEMKDIARTAEIGRSTLYRHFQSKEDIAFFIAKDILSGFHEAYVGVEFGEKDSGYEKFQRIVLCYMQVLIDNTDKVKFLDEFDQLFTETYPKTEEAQDFIKYNQSKNSIIYKIFQEGMQDGSIGAVDNPDFEADVLMHTILGLAQRVLPREEHFLEEHGYSTEYLKEAVRLLLNAIKA